ncbi:MAG: putative O-glycosylation ligase, exosortase A system-associated [Emcibacter sp.]|nr:putative O-glycosylation ligase, exosortase A system-associated [Emcibacter sp.]
MRDIFIFSGIILVVLATLRKPQIGILGWLWLSIMNPHKESFGWIYSLPVLDILAGATLISAVINFNQVRKSHFHPVLIILIIFYLWTCMTTIFAISFDLAFPYWIDFSKTILFTMLMLLFFNSKHWIIAAVFVFTLSVGFTSIKGGIFTVLTGGGTRIWGAPGTTWGDNNGVAIASVMVTPLIFALKDIFQSKVLRFGVYANTFFSFMCILGTQSRGGLVGILGSGFVYFIRSKHKIIIGLLIVIFGILILIFMPQSWKDRMETIQSYEQDESASARILQWRYAVQITSESPIIGNGFYARFYQPYYYKYLAGIDKNRAAHSNYFQVLEEQGYVGLFIFLLLIISAVISANRIAKKAQDRPDLKWASTLLFYCQFSITGYAFSGLTQNKGYLDLYYYILAFIILLISHINDELKTTNPQEIIKSSDKNR